MAMVPTCTPIAVARWFQKSLTPRSRPASSCATSTSPRPASKTSFCTTPEGACASELQNFYGHAWARLPGGAPQPSYAAAANVFATADVRFYFRPRNGGQRLYARQLQKPPAARHHGPEHGRHGHLGGSHAANFRIPIHPRNRRSPASTNGNRLASDRKSSLRHHASPRRRPHGHPLRLAPTAAGSRPKRSRTTAVRHRCGSSSAILRRRRPGPRLQHRAAPHRLNVLDGGSSDDLFRLHLLSVERVEKFPDDAETRTDQSSGLRQRRTARHPSPAIPAPAHAGGSRRAAVFRRGAE